LINQKRNWAKQGAPSKIVNQKKSAPAHHKSHPARLLESCGKCGRTNHATPACWVGTNKCIRCGSLEHLIVVYPGGLKAMDKGPASKAHSYRKGVYVEQERKLPPLVR